MHSFREGFRAVVIGASGGIGAAFCSQLNENPLCSDVVEFSRRSAPAIDLTDERSIVRAKEWLQDEGKILDLVIVATGVLSFGDQGPEKTIRHIDNDFMASTLQINAIGPALIIKHFASLLPKDSKSCIACLSARVGSIEDNRLGGWISYRASKAALNQIIRTASIELSRSHAKSVCLALHPGTVDTDLSKKFTQNKDIFSPSNAVKKLLTVIDQSDEADTGGFKSYDGSDITW